MHLIVLDDGSLLQGEGEIPEVELHSADEGYLDLVKIDEDGNFLQYHDGEWHSIKTYNEFMGVE